MQTGKVATGVVACAMAFVMIGSATSVRATLFPNTIVANDVPSLDLSNPAVAIGPDETIHVVWQDDRAGPGDTDIWYARSMNGGQSFGMPIRVTDMQGVGSAQMFPSIAVDANNVAHVVWTDLRAINLPNLGPIYYSHSVDNGGLISFTPNVPIAQQPTGWEVLANAVRARIVYDGSNGCALHVVWSTFDLAVLTFNFGIWYDKSSDCGATWGVDARVAPNNGFGVEASMDVASDGTVGIAYVGTKVPFAVYLIMRERDIWKAPQMVIKGAGMYGMKDPTIAIDQSLAPSNYLVHLAWADGRNINQRRPQSYHDYDIYYSRGTGKAGAISFATAILISGRPPNDFSEQSEPQITSDIGGNPRIAWTDWRNDPDGYRNPNGGRGTHNADIYYRESMLQGGSFGPESRLPYTQMEQSRPVLSVLPCSQGPCGGTYVVWNDERATAGLYDSRLAVPDFDEDGLTDWEERHTGSDGYITDPLVSDSDHDGLKDGTEVGMPGFDADPTTKTDPTVTDTDRDGLPDGWIDANSNGIRDLGEFEDRDLDGARDVGEWNAGAGPGETDPNNSDTDIDFETDYEEEVTGAISLYGGGTKVIPDPGSASLTTTQYGVGAPSAYMVLAEATVIVNHPIISQLTFEIARGTGRYTKLAPPTENPVGNVWVGHYNLLTIGYTYVQLTATSMWTMRVTDGRAGSAGVVLAFAITIKELLNPLNSDCDGDLLKDGREVKAPGIGDKFSDPWKMDTDGDGLTDTREITRGTNPQSPDSDADNLNDYEEAYTYMTNPAKFDSDDDGMSDYDEVNGLGVFDRDGDGLNNPIDPDSDGDLILDGQDARPLTYDDPSGGDFPLDVLAVNNMLGVTVAVDFQNLLGSVTITMANPPMVLEGAVGPHPYFQVTANAPINQGIIRVDLGFIPPEDRAWSYIGLYKWNSNPSVMRWELQRPAGVHERQDMWLRTQSFGLYAIADMRDPPDSDGDGLDDWEELGCNWSPQCEKGASRVRWTHSDVPAQEGDQFFISNPNRRIEIPPGTVWWSGGVARFTVDLIGLGFPVSDITGNLIWSVGKGTDTIITLLLTRTWDATWSARMEFSYQPGATTVGNANVRTTVWGTPDPLKWDTDGDGWSDGMEIERRTSPIDDDTDDDGVLDPYDYNPYVDAMLTVTIDRWRQLDNPDYSLNPDQLCNNAGNIGDFYARIYVNNEWSGNLREVEEGWNHCDEGSISPPDPVIQYIVNIPDNQQLIDVRIQMVDADTHLVDCDDMMDISRDPSSGDQNCDWNDMTRVLKISFNVASGEWTGDDSIGDSNGYMHADGEEDGSVGWDEANDQDDCEIWFHVRVNDIDNDQFGWVSEVNQGGDAAFEDNDAGEAPDSDDDGMWDFWEDMNRDASGTRCLNRFVADAGGDPDGDHLTNIRELVAGTNPCVADTDGDDINDGYESSIIGWIIQNSQIIGDRLNPLNAADGELYIDDLRTGLRDFVDKLQVDARLLNYNFLRDNMANRALDQGLAVIRDIIDIFDSPEDVIITFIIALLAEHFVAPIILETWDFMSAMGSLLDAGDFFTSQFAYAAEAMTGCQSDGTPNPPVLLNPGFIYLTGYATGCRQSFADRMATFDSNGNLVGGMARDLQVMADTLFPLSFDFFVQSRVHNFLTTWYDNLPSGKTGTVDLVLMGEDNNEFSAHFHYTGHTVEDDALTYANTVWQRWGGDYGHAGFSPTWDPCDSSPMMRCTSVHRATLEVVQDLVTAYADTSGIRGLLENIYYYYFNP